MADTLNITANVTEGQAVSSSVDEGVTISSNVVESTTVTANVVTGAKGDKGDPGTNGQGVPTGGTAGQILTKDSSTDYDTSWQDPTGAVDSVNGQTGVVVLDADDIDDTSTTHKFVTSADLTKLANTSGTNTGDQDLSGLVPNTRTINGDALSSDITLNQDDIGDGTTYKQYSQTEKSKLAGIETNADVTDATNVAAAGAVMEADTTTASMSFVVDEDAMTSNSATKIPTQQSVKAYVDTQVGGLDHGGLAGLSDDDHTQYALLAGRSGGQTLRGGTSKTNNLVLSANSQAYDNKSYGYIEPTHPIVWNDDINIGATFTGFFTEGYHRFISQTGTFTLDPTMNAGEVVALKSAATIKYSSSQIITASPTFMSQNTIQPTAAVNDNALASWSSYIANDKFMPLLTTAITATTTNFVGLQSAPTVGITAGSHASAKGVVTNLTAVEASSKVTAQGTATNARGVLVYNSAKEGSGIVTNNIGVDIEFMTSGSTLNVGLRIAPSTSTGAQAIQITGTPTTAAGGIAFGSDVNLYRSGAGFLRTDGYFSAQGLQTQGKTALDFSSGNLRHGTSSDHTNQQFFTGGTERMRINSTGNTSLGPNKLLFGTFGSEDTNLYRSAANTLATDDDFAINSTTKGVIMSDRSNGKKYRLYMDNGFLSQEEVA